MIEHLERTRFRRRAVPERDVAGHVVVAAPRSDVSVVLAPTAAAVWNAAGEWTSFPDLEAVLAERYADVDGIERSEALRRILTHLVDEDLVEREPL